MGDVWKEQQNINDLMHKNSAAPLMGFEAQKMFNVIKTNSVPKRTAMHVIKKETFLRPKKPKTQSDDGIFVVDFHLPSIWDLQSAHAKDAVAQMGKHQPPIEFRPDAPPKDKARWVARFKIPGNLQVKTQLARFQSDIHSYDAEKLLLSKKLRAPAAIPGKPVFGRMFLSSSVADVKVNKAKQKEAGRSKHPIGSQNITNYTFREVAHDSPAGKDDNTASTEPEFNYREQQLADNVAEHRADELKRLEDEFMQSLKD